jgi:ABC-2 type transport system permease protein
VVGLRSRLRGIATIARNDLALLRSDPEPAVVLLLTPLVLMGFFKPLVRLSLVQEGYAQASGAEQAVPGMAVMFSFFVVGYAGFAFFREHGWGTWDRLRVSARPVEILVGKGIPPLLVSLAQLGIFLVLGVAVFGLHIEGSIAPLALVVVSLSASLVGASLALVALSKSIQQLSALANLGGIVLAGIGGAMVPLSLLPEWVRTVAPVSPAYWAMRGFRTVLLDTEGVSGVVTPVLVLFGFAALFLGVARARFRFDEDKLSWS